MGIKLDIDQWNRLLVSNMFFFGNGVMIPRYPGRSNILQGCWNHPVGWTLRVKGIPRVLIRCVLFAFTAQKDWINLIQFVHWLPLGICDQERLWVYPLVLGTVYFGLPFNLFWCHFLHNMYTAYWWMESWAKASWIAVLDVQEHLHWHSLREHLGPRLFERYLDMPQRQAW